MNWFVQKGIFFRPVSAIGWGILLAALAWLGWAFFDIDSRSHSASDTLINWFFQWVIVGLIYTAVAYFTSKKT